MPHELAHQMEITRLEPGSDTKCMSEIMEFVTLDANPPANTLELLRVIFVIAFNSHELLVSHYQIMIQRNLALFFTLGVFSRYNEVGAS